MERAAQFERDRLPLLLTQEPIFTRKAALLPATVFALGWDTAARVVQTRYYDGAHGMAHEFAGCARSRRSLRARAIRAYRRRRSVRRVGSRFVVGGRLGQAKGDGGARDRFYTLDDIALPPSIADLFEGIPEELFRCDLSSSDLRAGLDTPSMV